MCEPDIVVMHFFSGVWLSELLRTAVFGGLPVVLPASSDSGLLLLVEVELRRPFSRVGDFMSTPELSSKSESIWNNFSILFLQIENDNKIDLQLQLVPRKLSLSLKSIKLNVPRKIREREPSWQLIIRRVTKWRRRRFEMTKMFDIIAKPKDSCTSEYYDSSWSNDENVDDTFLKQTTCRVAGCGFRNRRSLVSLPQLELSLISLANLRDALGLGGAALLCPPMFMPTFLEQTCDWMWSHTLRNRLILPVGRIEQKPSFYVRDNWQAVK